MSLLHDYFKRTNLDMVNGCFLFENGLGTSNTEVSPNTHTMPFIGILIILVITSLSKSEPV